MQVFKQKQALIDAVTGAREAGKSIGFVPTMGALHEGHLSLVKQASRACDQVVISIFVNPTQFDNPKDLEKYPQNLQSDLDLLSDLNGDFWIFAPSPAELYGSKVSSQNFNFDGLEKVMEGEFRAGHFNGVGTVVKILLETIKPDKAFFGEKDFQQLQIVRKLVEKAGLPVEIVGCPILREESGLARSSRNERLSELHREKASYIYETLQRARDLFGTESADYVRQWVQTQFENHPFLKLEYFEIANTKTLKKIKRKRPGNQYRAFIAAYAGDVRLIDNIALNS
ncbi:pantoate--beta-alanine ligase [Salegentibacter sp. HM20]